MKQQIITLMISALICAVNPAFGMELLNDEKHQNLSHNAPTWDFLKDGDSVEIIAPAGAPTTDGQVETAKKIISSHGLMPYLPEGAIDKENSRYGYYANSDQLRAHYFEEALQGSSKALWALRGGFGSYTVVESFERSSVLPPQQPKPIIGFSDITHINLLAATWKWPSLHGPVIGFGEENLPNVNKFTKLNSVIQILKGEVKQLEHTFEVIHPGDMSSRDIQGSVMGGNFSVIMRHNGTPTALTGKNHFIFLEDTAEDGKRLHDYFLSLVRTGTLNEAKGLIIGNLPLTGFPNDPEKTRDVIKYFVNNVLLKRNINIPVVYSPRFGHGDYNDVMPLGTKASLIVNQQNATLKVSVNESAY